MISKQANFSKALLSEFTIFCHFDGEEHLEASFSIESYLKIHRNKLTSSLLIIFLHSHVPMFNEEEVRILNKGIWS